MNELYHKICADYLSVVCRLISLYETLETNFPLGVLNEIRNVFTHLAKAEITQDKSEESTEFAHAKEHLKRAIRDGYKYNCLAYEKIYKNLVEQKLYGDVSSNEFLKQIEVAHDQAVAEVIEARSYERKVKADIVGGEFEHYENAFKFFEEMKNLIVKLHGQQV